MKNISITTKIASALILLSIAFFISCAPTQVITDRSGAQLWGENCNRCHNAPAPGEFVNASWDVIGAHMRIRANLTEAEEVKIINFLKGVE